MQKHSKITDIVYKLIKCLPVSLASGGRSSLSEGWRWPRLDIRSSAAFVSVAMTTVPAWCKVNNSGSRTL